MGFIAGQFAKISTGFYDGNHIVYSYFHNVDTLIDIADSGYFDEKAQAGNVQQGDLFIIRGADGTQFYIVTASTLLEITIVPFAQQNVQTDYIEISAAEIVLLMSAPKTLIAAPGADRLIQLVGAKLILDYGSVAYTETDDNLAIKYTDGSGVAVSDTIQTTGFIDQTADMVTNAVTIKDAIVTAVASVNKALVLHNIGDAEFATGDGTLTVAITYRILDARLA